MSTLAVELGPTNVLRGLFPSEPADRLPDHWLVTGPTFRLGVRAETVDQAKALVLVRLGYGSRPELADELNVRTATAVEVHACQAYNSTVKAPHNRRPAEPLHVTAGNRQLVLACARAIVAAEPKLGRQRKSHKPRLT